MRFALLDLTVLLLIALAITFVITQLIIPVFTGTPILQLLRKKSAAAKAIVKVEHDIEEASTEVLLKQKQDQLNALKAQQEK